MCVLICPPQSFPPYYCDRNPQNSPYRCVGFCEGWIGGTCIVLGVVTTHVPACLTSCALIPCLLLLTSFLQSVHERTCTHVVQCVAAAAAG